MVPSRSVLQNNNSLYLKQQKKILKKNVNILFNQGLDDFKNVNSLHFVANTLHIFLGHTAILNNTLDLLLPTCTFFEKETLYLNIENVLRESKIVLAPYLNMNVLVDWQIYFLFIKKKNLLSNLLRKQKYLINLMYFNKFIKFINKPVFFFKLGMGNSFSS